MSMANHEIVKHHLEAAIEDLEKAVAEGRYNTICIRSFSRQARALHFDAFADRALALLQIVPDTAFFAGAITNFEITADMISRLRTLRSGGIA